MFVRQDNMIFWEVCVCIYCPIDWSAAQSSIRVKGEQKPKIFNGLDVGFVDLIFFQTQLTADYKECNFERETSLLVRHLIQVNILYEPKCHNCRTNIVFIMTKKLERTDYWVYIREKQFYIFPYSYYFVVVRYNHFFKTSTYFSSFLFSNEESFARIFFER